MNYKIKEFFWNIKYAFQRFFNEYDDRSCFGLNSELQNHILFGVKWMKENAQGFPGIFLEDGVSDEDAIAKWNAILDEIIEGMQAGIEADECSWWEIGTPGEIILSGERERYAKRDKALALVVKYFDNLWD